MTDQATEGHEPSPPMGVSSSEGLGAGAGARQRPQCQDPIGMANCKNMKCTYEGFDGERYRCEVCGCSYFLDYEEMR